LTQKNKIVVGGFSHVNEVVIGGGSVPIQTMWKDRLKPDDLVGDAGKALLARVGLLWKMGCRLLRFAVPKIEDAEILGRLAGLTPMPLVADIHFDYKIALRCLDCPIAKLRINPGNIGGEDRVKAVLGKAAEKGVPIRIGVNSGSLPKELRERVNAGSLPVSEALVCAAERELEIFSKYDFTQVVVSLKSSSVKSSVEAARLMRERLPNIPLHIGVTEAGPLIAGVARSAAALHELLSSGIGDTIRVSLSSTMENEVIAAREILALSADTKREGIRIISCPRCGRASFDTHGFTEKWLTRLYAAEKTAVVAVMGCVVNGPGEARNADLGITGAGDKVLLFKHGKIIRELNAEDADAIFEKELEKL
jgi:(E)-4-hydroxy-3-methylbut-2-enyl-diphosphate synthase